MPRSSEQRGRRGLCRAPILCLTCGVLWGLLCCLTGLPAARGAAAVGEHHAGPDAALAEMTAAARLLAVLAPARSRPDDSEAQRAFIAAFPTDQAAFAAGMRLTGDAPLDWLLGLAQADNRALRQAARQRLRAVDPVRHIRAADSIYAAVNAWPCRDFLELARSPDPVVSAGALLLARNMAWPEKGRAALDSLRPGDGPDIRLLKLAAVVAWNGEAAVPDAAWEFVRAFPDDPRDLARLLTLENSLCRSEDSLTLSLLRDLARDGTPDLKMAADAKWRGARTLRRASLPPSAPVSGRKLARALLPFFADPDPGVSATAMLYAARLEAPGPLRAWLLKHADPEDTPLHKALAAYCLARWSPLDQERTAFSSGSQDEYMLVLGKQDREQERFLAQISIYLLPNTPKATAEDFARKMTELQGDASEPRKEGLFWTFTGVPRNQTVKGQAVTMVNTTPERILIIISQDPERIDADKVVAGLSGVTPEAKALLGR